MLGAAALAALLAAPLTSAQVVRFDSRTVPGPRTIQAYYLFYVYAAEDAPGRRLGDPAVSMQLTLAPDPASAAPAARTELAEYRSVQAVVLPLRDFDDNINTLSFCAPGRGAPANSTPEFAFRPAAPMDGVVSATVRGGGAEAHEGTLSRTDVYTLAVANCGDLTGFSIVGTVSVRNSFGYLPATEYRKIQLYGALVCLYAASSLAWGYAMLRRWGQAFAVQRSLLWVNLLALCECAAFWHLHASLNDTGGFNQLVFLIGAVVAVWKTGMLFGEALSASDLFDTPGDSRAPHIGVHLSLVSFTAVGVNFRATAMSRRAYGLDTSAVLASALPVVLVGILLFAAGWRELHRHRLALRKQRRDSQAALLLKSQVVMAAAGLGALAVWALHALEPGVSIDSRGWGGRCLAPEAMAHGVFAAVLAAAMFVWRPSEATGGSYAVVPSDVDGEAIGAAMG